MEKELLWSWHSGKPDSENLQLPLSITLEKLIVFIVLTALLIIFLMAIAPMLGAWSYFVFVVAYLVLLPYMFRNYKSTAIPEEEKHISLYTDEINIDYYGLKGAYELSNVHLDSIKVKYFIVFSSMYAGICKGLCFDTISPKMRVKVPLPVLEPSLSSLNRAINAIKYQSDEISRM